MERVLLAFVVDSTLNMPRRFRPRAVNLMALPTRLMMIWRSAHGVADDGLRDTSGSMSAEKFKAFFVGAQGEASSAWFPALAKVEADVFELELAGFDLGEVEDVVDDGEQRVRGELDGLQVVALLAR